MAVTIPLCARQAHAQMLTGTYVGDGTDNRNIGQIGFTIALLVIKGNSTNPGFWRSDQMPADSAKSFSSDVTIITNHIQALSMGFQLGSSAAVNQNGTTYYWAAWKAVAGEMETGTYTGNGADNRNITFATTWQPEFVFTQATQSSNALLRTSSQGYTGDQSTNFTAGALNLTDRIQQLNTNGFQIGSVAAVNQNGTTFYWAAWNSSASLMAVGSYTGNGSDGRNITNIGFTPEVVALRGYKSNFPVFHTGSMGASTDATASFLANSKNSADFIQSMASTSNGTFQVGTDLHVNKASTTYIWMAFARQNATAVLVTDAAAEPSGGGGVAVRWRTSFEQDHLGFHVWAEQGGVRTRATEAMIPGATLLEGAAGNPTSGRNYSWVDPFGDAKAASRPTYWVEAVDLAGKSTWHGPVEVKEPGGWVAARPRAVPETTSQWDTGTQTVARSWATRKVPGTTIAPSRPPVSVVRSAQTVAAPGNERWNAQRKILSSPGMRVGVDEAGWYQLTGADLVAAGFDPQTDPRRLRLFTGGEEQSLLVRGEEDGVLDGADTVEFLGQANPNPNQGERVYFLTWPAEDTWATAPRRVGVHGAAAASGPAGTGFLAVAAHLERKVYFAALLNGDEGNFFGPAVASGKLTEQTIDLPHVDRSATANAVVSVSLQGVTLIGHQVEIRLNGMVLGTAEGFSDRDKKTFDFPVPLDRLQDGPNLLTFTASGGDRDVSLLGGIWVTYPHTFVADDDSLRFTSPPGASFTVSGFTEASVSIVDITDTAAPEAITGRVSGTAASGYSVEGVAPAGAGPRTLLAFTTAADARNPKNKPPGNNKNNSQIKKPKHLKAQPASPPMFSLAPADFVIITHSSLIEGAERLRRARQDEGWAVQVVDVDALYDEYSFGQRDENAIKDFLREARGVANQRPGYVLLVGDASFDPENYLGFGQWDLVPTKMMDTSILETASDDWFVDFNNDGVGEMAIGRLPARTPADLSAMIDKTLAYKGLGASGARALVIGGREEGYGFAAAATRIGQAAAAAGFGVQRLSYEEARDPSTFATALAGARIVNYLGHGSVEEWTGIMRGRDVATMQQNPAPPIFLNMSCLNGFFHDVYTESLAERLLKAEGRGAVAVWASSTLTYPADQEAGQNAIYRSLQAGAALGDAMVAAKAATSSQDVRRSWMLFGDPTLMGHPPVAGSSPRDEPAVDAAVGGGSDGSAVSTDILSSAAGQGGCGCRLAGTSRTGLPYPGLLAIVLGCTVLARRRRRNGG